MAITKIHPITNTVHRAIDYISVPHKTSGACMISYYGCGKDDAAISFKHADSLAGRKSDYKAYHLIQSFAPFEVDEDTAHLIGKKLADKVLGGKNSYVLATHNDRNHIHNHIIFCAADNISHKKYHASRSSYYEIRHASDELHI